MGTVPKLVGGPPIIHLGVAGAGGADPCTLLLGVAESRGHELGHHVQPSLDGGVFQLVNLGMVSE